VRVRAERRLCSRVGANSEPELGDARRTKERHNGKAKERSRRCRQWHLQATGSARWPALKFRRVCAAARCGTAGDIQTASSQGSVQPRLEGRAHNKVEGVDAHLGSWTWRRRRRGGAEEEDWGSACCRGSRVARRHLQQVWLLFCGGDLTADGSGLGVDVRGSGCSGFAAAHARADGDENMHFRPPPQMALPQ
jgi:hypothetical protein